MTTEASRTAMHQLDKQASYQQATAATTKEE
jgi:hypothetical protein